jgi:redox-sensitive bicupin YhaK (pirin superfamily)
MRPRVRTSRPQYSEMNMTPSSVQVLQMQSMRPGSGAAIDHLKASREQLDPYIVADHFRMWEPTFGPHPHAGFSAVTYLFEDSETGFRNRDSRGQQNLIQPGDLHWTLAGSGVMHEEIPMLPGKVAHGLQMFVNLPAIAKQMPPAALHIESDSMPRFALGDGRAKLVFGQWLIPPPGQDANEHTASATPAAYQAPLTPAPGDATLLDLWLPANGKMKLQLPATQQAVVIGVEGHAELDGAQAPAWALSAGSSFTVTAPGSKPVRLALLAGTPWREPLFMQGPFGMASAADLQQAMARYQAGEMGRLAALPL